jgi:hypothetical protein
MANDQITELIEELKQLGVREMELLEQIEAANREQMQQR